MRFLKLLKYIFARYDTRYNPFEQRSWHKNIAWSVEASANKKYLNYDQYNKNPSQIYSISDKDAMVWYGQFLLISKRIVNTKFFPIMFKLSV